MEPEMEPMFSHLQEPGQSDIAGCAGDFIFSDNKEERGIPEDLKPDVLLEAPSPGPDREAASPKTPHRKVSSSKLAVVAKDQKPHAEKKPYKCTECGKGFKGHARLLKHLQTHTSEKLFECVECKKSFGRKANLVLHQRVHVGEKLYKCKECDKTFSHPSDLVAHRKTHAKKKAFACTICKKSFRGNAALFRHQRVHVNEKPYKCTECGSSFSLHSDFIKHQQIHLREIPSEDTAAANLSKFTSLHHKEEQSCGAGKNEMDHLNLLLEE
ncbi:PREDICTED: gastrula zinc finger protein XlCGF8.2DB-like, partial [Apaloderma vittatum]|uniref:gastrula zinc finger protein XlCGF8.2DB-like n=1 Tax=Apaloderma vittatum TaxID=57397 RepID=UPI0005215D40